MLLKKVSISGFKSFRKTVQLPISDRTTILVGPNDHGKTNALQAIDRLNANRPFQSSEVNDHLQGQDTAYISYIFRLAEPEIQALREAAQGSFQTAKPPQASSTAAQVTQAVADTMSETPDYVVHLRPWLDKLDSAPDIELIRQPEKAVQVKLDVLPEKFRPLVASEVMSRLPNVFLFSPDTLRQLPDTVDLAGLEKNEVMQGVFRLAGIWDDRSRLLSGNTRKNQDELRDASDNLTKRIRQNWTQGLDLEFYLEYVTNNIRLTVKDTSKSVTAVGERSEGFTAYFAMRMLLVARTNSVQPNGYVFMFDEPGLNLHPKGQVDLQNIFEDISRKNQIIYSTHSVFLINKNYPDRNHLIFKNQEGSNIDNKPFAGGWAKVKEHLGLYLSSNFLFSDKVLLAEGTTDEIYIPLILQGLVENNLFKGDLNAFAIQSGYTVTELIASADMYLREGRKCAALFDGDEEGNRRKQRLEHWKSRSKRECAVISLGDIKKPPCSIEDFLQPTLYREAVGAACKEAIDSGVIQPRSENWETDLRAQLERKENNTLGKRVEDVLTSLFGEAISDVWIARKYSELLRSDKPPAGTNLAAYWGDADLASLANALWKALDLPKRGDTMDIPLTTG